MIVVLNVDDKPYSLDIYSPMKQVVARGHMSKPMGDIKEAIFRMMTEDSLACLEDKKDEMEIDADFRYMEELLSIPDAQWD